MKVNKHLNFSNTCTHNDKLGYGEDRLCCCVDISGRLCYRPNLLLFMENLSKSMINQSHFDLCGQNGLLTK